MIRDPALRLLAAYPVLHQAIRQRVVPDGFGGRLSLHQATVLAHLDRTTALTLSELAVAIGVALPTMSLLIDRLVRGGLVRRERDPNDGRRVALRLTSAGARATASRSLVDLDRIRALLAHLSAPERAAGVEGFITLVKAARKLTAPGPDTPPARRGDKAT